MSVVKSNQVEIEPSISMNEDTRERIQLRYIQMMGEYHDTKYILETLVKEFNVEIDALKEILHLN